jgi:glycosyl transferase family WbsX
MAMGKRTIVDGFTGRFYDYAGTARNYVERPMPPYTFFRTVMPAWDNTPRKPLNSDIFPDASPEMYERWLCQIVDQTRQLRFGDERMVFINAWNTSRRVMKCGRR